MKKLASIMEGKSLQGDASAAVRNVKNPIILANKVVQHSDQILLIGEGAATFAKQHDIIFESDEYFYDVLRYNNGKR